MTSKCLVRPVTLHGKGALSARVLRETTKGQRA
jgi:hypothetical protein